MLLRRPAGKSAEGCAIRLVLLLSPGAPNYAKPYGLPKDLYLGTTMETCFIAVPPRRFEPIIEIVCCPGSSASVK
jgi:hypothetical protein